MNYCCFNRFISKEDKDLVSLAVREAEKHTSGEIVPIIVRSSSTTDHSFPFLFVSLLLCFSLSPWRPMSGVASLLAEIIFALAFAFGLSRLDFIKRILIPKKDQILQCERRALLEFFLHGVDRTKGSTGILIFTSLLEKKIVILADKAINEKVPSGTWDDILKKLQENIKNGKIQAGYKAAIESCRDILKVHFPVKPDETNELSNELILKD